MDPELTWTMRITFYGTLFSVFHLFIGCSLLGVMSLLLPVVGLMGDDVDDEEQPSHGKETAVNERVHAAADQSEDRKQRHDDRGTHNEEDLPQAFLRRERDHEQNCSGKDETKCDPPLLIQFHDPVREEEDDTRRDHQGTLDRHLVLARGDARYKEDDEQGNDEHQQVEDANRDSSADGLCAVFDIGFQRTPAVAGGIAERSLWGFVSVVVLTLRDGVECCETFLLFVVDRRLRTLGASDSRKDEEGAE